MRRLNLQPPEGPLLVRAERDAAALRAEFGDGLVGAATFTATTTTMAEFQTAVEPTMRGRASATLGLCSWTSATLAALLWGYIATSHGVGTALIAAAATHLASTVALATVPRSHAAPPR